MALPHGGAALFDRYGRRGAGGRPLDRDRVALDRRQLAAVGDGEHFAIDARLDEALDRVEEIVAVKLRVKAENAAPQQPVEHLFAPRADPECLRVGPGDVPEGDDGGFGERLADQARQQREVIIVHEDDRVVRAGLVDHRAREQAVGRGVLLPVGRAEYRAHVRDVTQRPQPLVGEPVVVARLLLLGQPDAAELVEWLRGGRRDRNAVVRVHHLAVCRAAAVRDPRARARSHDRFERGDEPTRRPPDGDVAPPVLSHMDVRLAVRDDDHLLPAQLPA